MVNIFLCKTSAFVRVLLKRPTTTTSTTTTTTTTTTTCRFCWRAWLLADYVSLMSRRSGKQQLFLHS